MLNSEPASPGLFTSVRKLVDTSLAALQNRAELLAVEFQQEKDAVIEMVMWVTALLFFAIMAVMVLTATIILIFPPDLRVYVAGVLALLYLAGAVWAFLGLRMRLRNRSLPFSSTVQELKTDREWLLK